MAYSKPLIRLVILDDHPIIRRALEIVIAGEKDIDLAGSFGHSRDLIKWLDKEMCDILILDYVLHDEESDGLSLIKELLMRYTSLKILLVSSIENTAIIRSAFVLGIRGYITKREEREVFLDAIRTVAANKIYIRDDKGVRFSDHVVNKAHVACSDLSSCVKELAINKHLTPCELEVIHYFLTGMRVTDIAIKLKRSSKTVSGHKQSALRKLGLNSDLELFIYHEDLFR